MAIIPLHADPQSGVLVLLDRKETTGPFFITEHNKELPVVSLRQPPELCGVEEPELQKEAKELWTLPYREQFCRSLQTAIVESGIKRLLIADGNGGKNWEVSPYGGSVKGVEIEDVKANISFFSAGEWR